MVRLSFRQAMFAFLLSAFALFSLSAPLAAAQAVPDTTQQEMQLDINTADAATIAAALDGIGMVKAEEIVAYREMFGKFRTVEELLEVNGIGTATVERNRSRILIVNN